MPCVRWYRQSQQTHANADPAKRAASSPAAKSRPSASFTRPATLALTNIESRTVAWVFAALALGLVIADGLDGGRQLHGSPEIANDGAIGPIGNGIYAEMLDIFKFAEFASPTSV
jgi:hypothetical protein